MNYSNLEIYWCTKFSEIMSVIVLFFSVNYSQVDHTTIQYLVDPSGEFAEYFGQNKTAEDIAAGVTKHMISYKLLQILTTVI